MPLPSGVRPLTPELEKLAVNSGGASTGSSISYVDESSGAPFLTRLAGGKQFDDAGVVRWLRAKYDKPNEKNVLPKIGPGGEIEGIVYRENAKDTWKEYDPRPKGIISAIKDIPGDIADVSGDIVEGAAQAAGVHAGAQIGSAVGPIGAVAGGLVGGFGMGVLANAERQAEVAAMPGAQPQSIPSRAEQALKAGNLAVISEGPGKLVGAAGRAVARQVHKAVRPAFRNARNILGERLPVGNYEAITGTGRTAADTLQEGLALEGRLSKTMGEPVEMSVAQLSDSRKAAGFENIARTATETMGAMHAIDTDAARQLGRGMDAVVDRVSKGELTGEKATGMLGFAYNSYLNGLIDTMHEADKVAFGRVAMATKGGKLFSVKPLLDYVSRVAPDYAGAGPTMASATEKYMTGMVKDVLDSAGVSWAMAKGGAPALTARQMQSVLRQVGKRVVEGETVDMPISIGGQKASGRLNRSDTQQVARGMFRALYESLDDAIAKTESGKASEEAGAVAKLLREARDGHRKAMEGIEASQQAFGDMAIDLVDKDRGSLGPKRFLARTPEELASMASMLRKTPEGEAAIEKMTGASLRSIVEDATVKGPGDPIVSPAKLSSGLFANRKKLAAIMGEQDTAVLNDLTDFARRLERVNVFGGQSQTTPMKEAISLTPGRAGASQAAMATANAVLRKLHILQSPESMLRTMNDREQLKLMLKLMGPRAYERPIEETSRMASKLLGIQAAKLPAKEEEELRNKILDALGLDAAIEGVNSMIKTFAETPR
jgi:hypothetical protein